MVLTGVNIFRLSINMQFNGLIVVDTIFSNCAIHFGAKFQRDLRMCIVSKIPQPLCTFPVVCAARLQWSNNYCSCPYDLLPCVGRDQSAKQLFALCEFQFQFVWRCCIQPVVIQRDLVLKSCEEKQMLVAKSLCFFFNLRFMADVIVFRIQVIHESES